MREIVAIFILACCYWATERQLEDPSSLILVFATVMLSIATLCYLCVRIMKRMKGDEDDKPSAKLNKKLNAVNEAKARSAIVGSNMADPDMNEPVTAKALSLKNSFTADQAPRPEIMDAPSQHALGDNDLDIILNQNKAPSFNPDDAFDEIFRSGNPGNLSK